VTQQQLGEPVAGAHEIAAQSFAGTNQVAHRFLLDARHRDRMQLAGSQQPDQSFGVALIGLDPIARPARHQTRRADHAAHTGPRQSPRERKAGRPDLIGHPHRPFKPGDERGDLVGPARQPPTPKLSGLPVKHRRDGPPDMDIQPNPGLSLRHVGTPMIAVRAQATPEP